MSVSTVTTQYGYTYLSCDCAKTAIRYRIQSNGVGVFVYQCLTCGRSLRQVSKTSPEVLALTERTPFDNLLQGRWREYQQKFNEEARAIQERQREQEAAEQNATWWRRYNRYLTTPEWQERRQLVFARSGGICEGCRKRKATQVHHLTYEHVEHEFLFELVAICSACHRRMHPDMEW